MLKFVSLNRETPDKRAADERRRDFGEIYESFAREKAAAQASRCSQCGVPFCQDHCPLGNNIPDWLRLVAEGRLQEAYAVSSQTNNMPEVCGRICPQDRLCEGSCVIEQSGHGTVTIGSVESYITDTAFENGWVKPVSPLNERAESVGIVGAGPAGLAAAEELRKAGIQVVIYDRYDRPGGLLIYGIPNFKLDKGVVAKRIDHLIKSGVRFETDFDVGRDASLSDLRKKHDAVLIATGVYQARALGCEVDGAIEQAPALDFLTGATRRQLGDKLVANEGYLSAHGKRVVVIGGGDTAMDCVRTAIRQGAQSVACLYRRDRANMPGSLREVANAEEEGVHFEWLAAPHRIGHQVEAIRMRLGSPDASGRRRPVAIENGHFAIDADLVIEALGFEAGDAPGLLGGTDLNLTARGTIKVDHETLETSIPGIYAAGDIVRGASLVVWAIRDGRVAAHAMIERFHKKAVAPKIMAAE